MQSRYKIFRVVLSLVFTVFFAQNFVFAQNTADFPAKRDPATNLSTEREKSEIYPKLRDRRCTTMTLDKCNCPEAREMKAYIEALIETGVNVDEIFYKVAKKFSPNTILDKQIKAQVEERLIKEAGGKIPKIVLEPSSFNLGQLSKKQGKIQKVFKLYNNGTAPLIVSNIKVSCSCVTASLVSGKNKSPDFGAQGAPSGWQETINPGESAKLEVVVDLSHSAITVGKLFREITISGNDIINPEVTVKIEGEVKE